MKILLKGALFIFFALIFVWVILPVSADCEVYGKVVRLHVVADSDSDQAQRVKLLVRDALLEKVSSLTQNASDANAAMKILAENRAAIENEANVCLKELGVPYRAKVELGREDFPTKTYGALRLPAGNYLSLRVKLGSGEGKNWWCVLFPQLCLGCAEPEEELVGAGIGRGSAGVFTVDTPRFRFRFRILEFLCSVCGF
ncbi:MAG: stage II sporulation protein R [Clostridia bacterium]|nr:stage II sporulation protein R [Clostridia bacterium]